MTQKPALIFDFGGVLLDWNPRYLYHKFFDGDAEAMERFLLEVDFSGWNLEQDKGRPFAQGVAELSTRFPHYAHLIRAYDERWEESIIGPIQPSVDALRPLKDSGCRLYGLTNWSAEKFELARHKFAFLDLFESILVSGAVKLIKPDPRIFKLLLDQIGRPASECVFIDDSAGNVAAACQLGLNAIHFTSPEQMQAELLQMGISYSL